MVLIFNMAALLEGEWDVEEASKAFCEHKGIKVLFRSVKVIRIFYLERSCSTLKIYFEVLLIGTDFPDYSANLSLFLEQLNKFKRIINSSVQDRRDTINTKEVVLSCFAMVVEDNVL